MSHNIPSTDSLREIVLAVDLLFLHSALLQYVINLRLTRVGGYKMTNFFKQANQITYSYQLYHLAGYCRLSAKKWSSVIIWPDTLFVYVYVCICRYTVICM